MQQGDHMSFAEWTPKALQASWYGHVFTADFIGNNTGKSLRVKELNELPNKTSNPHLAGYAGYEDEKLAKIALVNLQFWNGSEDANKPHTTVELNLAGVSDGTHVTVRRLTGPNSTASQNITWAGLDWPYAKQGQETRIKTDTIEKLVHNEIVAVDIRATEALLLSW